jgi:hypothetical protein
MLVGRTIIALLLFFSAAQLASAADCQTPAKRYSGDLFDAMAQIDAGMEETVLRSIKEAGVSRMALFARDRGKRSGTSAVANLARQQPATFVIGVPKSFSERVDLSDSYVDQALSGVTSGTYRFVGEILFAHADKAHGEQTPDGERYVDPMGPGTRRLLDGMKGMRAPVMAHWEVYDWDREWPNFQKLYADYPQQLFIWPHAGFGSAAQVDEVMAAHSNVLVTLSKKESHQRAYSDGDKAALLGEGVTDRCGELLPHWREIMVKYRDRLVFATDAHKDFRWAQYAEIVERWRGILGQLPADVAQSIAYGNAARIYGK